MISLQCFLIIVLSHLTPSTHCPVSLYSTPNPANEPSAFISSGKTWHETNAESLYMTFELQNKNFQTHGKTYSLRVLNVCVWGISKAFARGDTGSKMILLKKSAIFLALRIYKCFVCWERRGRKQSINNRVGSLDGPWKEAMCSAFPLCSISPSLGEMRSVVLLHLQMRPKETSRL